MYNAIFHSSWRVTSHLEIRNPINDIVPSWKGSLAWSLAWSLRSAMESTAIPS